MAPAVQKVNEKATNLRESDVEKINFKGAESIYENQEKTSTPLPANDVESPFPEIMKTLQVNSVHETDKGKLCRLADLLFGTKIDFLEKIIYQISKALFIQSLTHNSEESSVALQKLTVFLEHEGSRGQVSQNLQKKVLGKI